MIKEPKGAWVKDLERAEAVEAELDKFWRAAIPALIPGSYVYGSVPVVRGHPAQRKAGIDRFVVVRQENQAWEKPNTWACQEKVRFGRFWGDILFEDRHVRPDGTSWPGWEVELPCAGHHLLAWVWPETKRGFVGWTSELFPVLDYCCPHKKGQTPNDGYVTHWSTYLPGDLPVVEVKF